MTSRRRRSLLLGGAAGALLMVLGSAATANAVTVQTYPTAPGIRLNVRSGPGTNFTIVRVLPSDTRVPIFCQSPGTTVSGYYGTSNIWDNIDSGEYVSDAYVNTGSDGYVASRCG
ncbi:SH3 domain-containing protein [Streptomyces griseorubiginosus]|uniref:SH3 domain-containing protein n=1 Tax=Streptomyces griseorubiginosus TaxID=67304 RepID=UPI001AD78B55|nr:SH3 domain-containing protein [Streptomyces griseorubiginosus]MBO4258503.1 SH3 domain-containing protein [Streptomyces griseorubiginosus]